VNRPEVGVDWYLSTGADVAQQLEVDPSIGLDPVEVDRRQARYGRNELEERARKPAWLRFLEQFNNALAYILAGAAVVSALVGDLKDPVIIALVLVVNAIMGFIQENRADEALAALRKMLTTTARVRRAGVVVEVPAGELVPGDVVLLEAGDRVPADGRFVLAANVSLDESMLTGESEPVVAVDGPLEDPANGPLPLAERSNTGFMNSTLVRGRAELLVTETGMRTEIGRLAERLGAAEPPATPLQRQIAALGTRLALIAVGAVVVVFLVALAQADQIDATAIGDALITSVALAVAAIPEGLPAVVTVTLAIGVGRLARRNAIVKRLPSVETLGSTTVICSDKTGTLTLNEMTATLVVVGGVRHVVEGLGYEPTGRVVRDGHPVADGDELLAPALSVAVLCNDAHLRYEDGSWSLVGDPTEGALVVMAEKAGVDAEAVRRGSLRRGELPFDSATKLMATVHDRGDGQWLAVKGAPDVVLGRCDRVRGPGGVVDLDDAARSDWSALNDTLGSQGLRVLALASRNLAVSSHEEDVAANVRDLCLEAFVGLRDPARPEARDAIELCGHAGIAVKMITGDHPSTAAAIATELGIEGDVVTGTQLDALGADDLRDSIESIGVCARVSPEHKVRVVEALQSRGHVVAMTGDGVNDAPSLRQAEIGVAMGVTGTEVTKEAGDMILTDDNFATIVNAVKGGRAIYDNILTFVRFQLTTNISAIATILVGQLLGMGTVFTAVQILFVNVIADGPPAVALGVDPPKPGVMDRPPRGTDERILSGRRLSRIVFAATIIAAGTLAVFLIHEPSGRATAVTVAFSTFVLFQLVNSLCVRSGDLSVLGRYTLTNRPLLLAIGVVALLQFALVQIPWFGGVLDTVPLSWQQWGWVVGAPMVLLAAEEARSLAARRRSTV